MEFAEPGKEVERMVETIQIAAITGNIANGEIFLTGVDIAGGRL
jgi:nitrogen regulatory protein PII